jgi:hypothetical protein
MLHACIERFDVMDGKGNILGWEEEVNKASDLRVATSPRRHATIHLHSPRANVPSALFAVMLRSGRRPSTVQQASFLNASHHLY